MATITACERVPIWDVVEQTLDALIKHVYDKDRAEYMLLSIPYYATEEELEALSIFNQNSNELRQELGIPKGCPLSAFQEAWKKWKEKHPEIFKSKEG